MQNLVEKIKRIIEEKAMNHGLSGQEPVSVSVRLTDEEINYFKTLSDFDNENYFWTIEDNFLEISYTEEVHRTPQEKWQKKTGLISKSYKLNKDVVQRFAVACENAGTTQAKQLTKMMEEFIDSSGNKK